MPPTAPSARSGERNTSSPASTSKSDGKSLRRSTTSESMFPVASQRRGRRCGAAPATPSTGYGRAERRCPAPTHRGHVRARSLPARQTTGTGPSGSGHAPAVSRHRPPAIAGPAPGTSPPPRPHR
jgi:hypothetical protein